jgi:hypothetical protein
MKRYRIHCATGNQLDLPWEGKDFYRLAGQARKLDEEPVYIEDLDTGLAVWPIIAAKTGELPVAPRLTGQTLAGLLKQRSQGRYTRASWSNPASIVKTWKGRLWYDASCPQTLYNPTVADLLAEDWETR